MYIRIKRIAILQTPEGTREVPISNDSCIGYGEDLTKEEIAKMPEEDLKKKIEKALDMRDALNAHFGAG